MENGTFPTLLRYFRRFFPPSLFIRFRGDSKGWTTMMERRVVGQRKRDAGVRSPFMKMRGGRKRHVMMGCPLPLLLPPKEFPLGKRKKENPCRQAQKTLRKYSRTFRPQLFLRKKSPPPNSISLLPSIPPPIFYFPPPIDPCVRSRPLPSPSAAVSPPGE